MQTIGIEHFKRSIHFKRALVAALRLRAKGSKVDDCSLEATDTGFLIRLSPAKTVLPSMSCLKDPANATGNQPRPALGAHYILVANIMYLWQEAGLSARVIHVPTSLVLASASVDGEDTLVALPKLLFQLFEDLKFF